MHHPYRTPFAFPSATFYLTISRRNTFRTWARASRRQSSSVSAWSISQLLSPTLHQGVCFFRFRTLVTPSARLTVMLAPGGAETRGFHVPHG